VGACPAGQLMKDAVAVARGGSAPSAAQLSSG
jgi:hypothetical protein